MTERPENLQKEGSRQFRPEKRLSLPNSSEFTPFNPSDHAERKIDVMPQILFESSAIKKVGFIATEHRSDYYIPDEAKKVLDGTVYELFTNPRGKLVDVSMVREDGSDFDKKKVVETLPEDLSEETFVNILRLAMLTECATESYAEVFDEGSKEHRSPWMTNFNRKVWVPDELLHAEPFKRILLGMGFSEEDLNRQIKDAQESTYAHTSGGTPVELTTYGMIQELLTDHWHGLIARILKPAAPKHAEVVNGVKKRETLHTVWYKDMTATQVKGNPELFHLVASAIAKFTMPGTKLVPELQQHSKEWIMAMGGDFKEVGKNIFRSIFQAVGSDTRVFGRTLLEIGDIKDMKAGPVSAKRINSFVEGKGGKGAGLIGEAALHKFDLDPLLRGQDRSLSQKAKDLVRAPLRIFVARWLDLNPANM